MQLYCHSTICLHDMDRDNFTFTAPVNFYWRVKWNFLQLHAYDSYTIEPQVYCWAIRLGADCDLASGLRIQNGFYPFSFPYGYHPGHWLFVWKVKVKGRNPSLGNECLFLLKLFLPRLRFVHLGSRRRPPRSRKLLVAAQRRRRECATVRKRLVLVFFTLNYVSLYFTFPTSAARVRYGLTVPNVASPILCGTRLCPGEPVML